jgi:hypothetical protein
MSKKQKPIEVENIDLEKMEQLTTDLPSLIEYAHTRGGFAVVPTQEGHIKTKALAAMEDQTQKQMDQILGQMRTLAAQAKEIKDRVEVSEQIYLSEIKFQPVIHEIYYLYRKNDQKLTLSMISPDDWGDKCKYEACLAKVKLLADHTWDVIERYDL